MCFSSIITPRHSYKKYASSGINVLLLECIILSKSLFGEHALTPKPDFLSRVRFAEVLSFANFCCGGGGRHHIITLSCRKFQTFPR